MRDERGFTLVESMVALGVALAGTYALMSLIAFTGRANRSLTQSTDFVGTANLIAMALADPGKCADALQTAGGAPIDLSGAVSMLAPNAPDTPISKIVMPGPVTIVDTSVTTDSVRITRLVLKQVVAGDPDSTVPYTMILRVEGTKAQANGADAVGGARVIKEIPLSVVINAPTDIVRCSSATPLTPDAVPNAIVAYDAPGAYNFTVPPGVNRVRVRLVGGGGGGGGNNAAGTVRTSGGAGGAGGYCEGVFSIAAGAVIPVTVGSPGAQGGVAGNSGGDGTASAFGIYCSATGGRGGGGYINSCCGGGLGGEGSGGTINIAGGIGGDGGLEAGGSATGGASLFGGGKRSWLNDPLNGGVWALFKSAPGSGGGSCWSNQTPCAGSPGAPGLVLVEY